nr:MAG TPA: Helix-turn-helix XRE-family like protein [Caudoviricetes sp.]
MIAKGYNIAELSRRTGIGKPSISQYLSGKNKPSEKRIRELAEALEVDSMELDTGKIDPSKIKTEQGVYNLPVKTAAELMGVSLDFVYNGLRDGVLPFGWAVKNSSIWTYYISSAKFTEYTGIQVPQL